MLYDENDLPASQQFAIEISRGHMKSEDIASKINTIENLCALYQTAPEPLKSETLKVINENIKFAKDNNIDIVRTLSKFFVMKD